MVPVQFWLLTSVGIDPTIAIRIAFGTSLAVAFPTAVSGALGHRRKGAIVKEAAIFVGISGLAGGFLGAFVAAHTSANILRMIFGLMYLVVAFNMMTESSHRSQVRSEKMGFYLLLGLLVGFISGLIGIGGGALMVPALVIFMGFEMHRAVGTSSAIMIFTTFGGAISYILNGLDVTGLPPFSFGYVNYLQWALLAGTSIPMARIGASASHLLPEKQLRWIFAVLMLYMALKMMGIFEFLQLPI